MEMCGSTTLTKIILKIGIILVVVITKGTSLGNCVKCYITH